MGLCATKSIDNPKGVGNLASKPITANDVSLSPEKSHGRAEDGQINIDKKPDLKA